MKIRLKEKHWELGRHYARFVDSHWYPDFVLDARALEIFVRVESAGHASCSEEELQIAAPLFNGKMNRELTIKLLFDEMADWWSMGAGWFAPIAHTLQTEMWSHGLMRRDRVFIRTLVKIMRACKKDGFQSTMLSFTGMSQEDKRRYCDHWLVNNPTPLLVNQ